MFDVFNLNNVCICVCMYLILGFPWKNVIDGFKINSNSRNKIYYYIVIVLTHLIKFILSFCLISSNLFSFIFISTLEDNIFLFKPIQTNWFFSWHLEHPGLFWYRHTAIITKQCYTSTTSIRSLKKYSNLFTYNPYMHIEYV